ncbi:hypothetical protein [Luteimonas sp. FCS-9]|uniref:hypothetical protein n=1 Tax=Luteimonas sp. FCS-9 TaxID=1547516 RepID=UPI000AEE8FF8|nr:hypothetical protein [Luteimonas sp. FCS-9]
MMTSKKSSSNPRELITPNEGDSRYQRRNDDGTLADGDKVSRAQPADKARKSTTVPDKGQGDKGDHKPVSKKKS